jgi:glycine/D-amino acid oxidase-like deaminating enzyme
VLGEEAGPPANDAHAARLAGHAGAFPSRGIALEHAERIGDAARKYVPCLPRLDVADVRICYRPMPLDGYPVLGASPTRPDVYLAITHSGVTLAPVVGALVAQEILAGTPAESLEEFRPGRRFIATTGH